MGSLMRQIFIPAKKPISLGACLGVIETNIPSANMQASRPRADVVSCPDSVSSIHQAHSREVKPGNIRDEAGAASRGRSTSSEVHLRGSC